MMIVFGIIGFVSFLGFIHIVFFDGDQRRPLKTAWDSIVKNEPPPSMTNFKGVVAAIFFAAVIIVCAIISHEYIKIEDYV
ncbi:MAG TPA: hypothetical protein PKG52_04780, partial [bacterium]|nr:hypothetical protein [bacterium]